MFVLCAIIAVPTVLAKCVVGAGWLQVGCAFLVWMVGGTILLSGGSVRPVEAFGWTMILGMFWNWLLVPAIALLLRVVNLPGRWL